MNTQFGTKAGHGTSQGTLQEMPTMVESAEFTVPRADLIKAGNDCILEVELPGVRKEDVNISVEDGQLKIVARRAPREAGSDYIDRESSSESYQRTFDLEPPIRVEETAGILTNGILQLKLSGGIGGGNGSTLPGGPLRGQLCKFCCPEPNCSYSVITMNCENPRRCRRHRRSFLRACHEINRAS